jgi:hypothetical protein
MSYYSPEEIWKLYQHLPQEIKDALFSDEIFDEIEKIGKRYNLNSQQITQLSDLVTTTLLGLLPVESLEETLIKDLKLGLTESKRITIELYRYIFYPLKASLEQVYGREIKMPLSQLEVPQKREKREDIYREPIE